MDNNRRKKGIGLNNLSDPVYHPDEKTDHGFIPLYETVEDLIVMKPSDESLEKQ